MYCFWRTLNHTKTSLKCHKNNSCIFPLKEIYLLYRTCNHESRYHLCRAAGLFVLLSRVIWSCPGLGWLRISAGALSLLVHLFGMLFLAASVLNSLLCLCLSSAAV